MDRSGHPPETFRGLGFQDIFTQRAHILSQEDYFQPKKLVNIIESKWAEHSAGLSSEESSRGETTFMKKEFITGGVLAYLGYKEDALETAKGFEESPSGPPNKDLLFYWGAKLRNYDFLLVLVEKFSKALDLGWGTTNEMWPELIVPVEEWFETPEDEREKQIRKFRFLLFLLEGTESLLVDMENLRRRPGRNAVYPCWKNVLTSVLRRALGRSNADFELLLTNEFYAETSFVRHPGWGGSEWRK